LLDDAAAVERPREFRVELERGVVIGQRLVEIAKLEIDKRTTVNRVGVVRPAS
jgi:hypothetical protein